MIFNPFSSVDLSGVIIWVLGLFLFFIVVREIVTWYWKINRIVNLLEKIEENTRKISAVPLVKEIPVQRAGPFADK